MGVHYTSHPTFVFFFEGFHNKTVKKDKKKEKLKVLHQSWEGEHTWDSLLLTKGLGDNI